MPLTLRCLVLLIAVLGGVGAVLAADRTVYLTFDDGPLNGTANVLAVLEAEGVPAAMFMVGSHAAANAGNKALLAKAKSLPNVTVGNHSYSHANNRYKQFYSYTEGVVADMLEANSVLGLNRVPIPARLPGRDVFRLLNLSRNDLGIGSAESRLEEVDYEFVAASGFVLYGWDHEWVHLDDGKPVQSVTSLISEIGHLFGRGRLVKKNKLILLMHDQMFQDTFDGRQKLTELIAGLRQRGYAFGAIGDYDS